MTKVIFKIEESKKKKPAYNVHLHDRARHKQFKQETLQSPQEKKNYKLRLLEIHHCRKCKKDHYHRFINNNHYYIHNLYILIFFWFQSKKR